ncbi:MAG: DEAD/DEAH box helicase [Bacilli bacterium]|jgi:ATP-dependent RNA helicase DeaD|nr:DEAD/DEAH box helicase [Bacilli bacterium]
MKITDLPLPEQLTKAVLKMGYNEFTAVQEETLPALLAGQDVLAEAPTGTGKTAAYSLPMLASIHSNDLIEGLIVCPTRELAIQVISEISKYAKYLPSVKSVTIYGGQSVATQLSRLRAKPQIVVGTPGRLNDLLERGALNFSNVHYLVLDECDEMLEMGFIKDVNKIIERVTSPHQTALFSATISPEIRKIAGRYLKSGAKEVSIKRTPNQDNQIAQKYVLVREEKKKEAIVTLINSLSFSRAFVFCRTKHKVMQIEKILAKMTSHAITSLQGNMSQNKRDRAMKSFRNYESDVMVATDIAARGIDVSDVDLVVNYDIPEEDEFYLHRIGRTGRVDKSGVSYTFINQTQKRVVKKYEGMTHCVIEECKLNGGTAMKNYLESLDGELKNDLTEEKKAIEEACETLSKKEGKTILPLDLAAILLKDKMNVAQKSSEDRCPTHYQRSEKHTSAVERNKEKKRFVTDPDNQRFFINVGYEDGANDESIKRFVMKYAKDVEEDDFADVYVRGTFSFFELPKDLSKSVIDKIEGTNYGTKLMHVEKTDRDQQNPKKSKQSKPKASHSDARQRHKSDGGFGGFRKGGKRRY